MLKIHALNRESSSDEDIPVIQREAQEEIALELYNKALRLQSGESLPEAEEILLNLIAENIPQLENDGGLPSSMSTLKYSCYFNLGNIYIKKRDQVKALDYYLSASELDATSVSLWYKIGLLAIDQNKFRKAAYALSQGLECSESHWPCLDKLISVLYATKDMISCLYYIGRALSLDPDYAKGLVLRRQIYRDNPAALPYYQKYNADSIWEPPLDVSIDDEDEKMILAKEQILADKIAEVEKSLAPKPLQTIPLPKPLEDFTWISLGKVLTYLHQYISDNDMSHFTMVDIHKCMSQIVTNNVIETEIEVIEPAETAAEDIAQEKIVSEDVNEDDNKTDTEAIIVERRPSQNSENNNEQENTPIQTDNDEEQIVDVDLEDADENPDNKMDKNRSLNKSSKRKRDLLSDLQIWGWHSKRRSTKKGKTDKDFTVEDALNRIIPLKLLKTKVGKEKFNQMEDSMNTMDMYNMYVEDQKNFNILSPIHSPKSVNFENYFGTDRELEDVQNLWTKERDYCDSCVLIRDFVLTLSKLWHTKWPKELVQIYMEAYVMYREHYDHLDVFSGDSPFCELRDDALATLLYGELVTFSTPESATRAIHISSLSFLQIISGWQDDWREEFVSVFLRVYWLRCHIFRKELNNDLAIRALELMQEVMMEEESKGKEKIFLSLPNCFKCGLISKTVATKILKHLDMITSLHCLEELFNSEKYTEVANILKLTFTVCGGNVPSSGKMGRPAQLAMLLHSLWFTNLTECFVWTEECLHEALPHFLKPGNGRDKWEKIVEKCLMFFQEIIKMETVAVVDALSEDKRCRLVEGLAKIICKNVNSESSSKVPLGCVTPWILLHFILVREEHRVQASKKTSHTRIKNKSEKCDTTDEPADNLNEELPPSVAILFSAHEFLGPKGWCLTNNGELLHFILDTILDRLDTPIFELVREKIDIHIEQSLFCLYQHPSKKNKISRHLADHNVDPLPLTWDRSFQLYEFYGPDSLPEFNSYKNASISSDLEQLLQRIIALVPPEMDPQPHVGKVTDFINGKTTDIPDGLDFSNKVRAIYYLIGDYYFKQREFNRCIKYFLMDLCINPARLDSWACIGLSYISQLENKLNYCKKLKSEMEFLDKARCAQICFRKALDLEKDNMILWIEFGSFEYMVHSFCSRVMKSESDTLSMEKFEYLENQKDNYLESAGRNFEKAIHLYQTDDSDADERWLQYYILGKVAEKQQKEPNDYLQYYVTASKLLHENNCIYPEKINYHNPQHLAVEALELHYRINASILKYLELHEGKEIPNLIGNCFKQYMENSYYPKKMVTPTPQTVNVKSSEQSKMEEINKEVKKCVSDLIDTVSLLTKEKKTQIGEDSNNGKCKNSDVIMISDSEDENNKSPLKKERQVDNTGDNVQEFLDKMMQETMKTSEEQEPDSDTSMTSKIVTEVKVDEIVKVEKQTLPQTDSKMETSETETDIRTSVDESSSSSSSSNSSSSSSSESDSDDDSSSSSSSSSSEATNGNMSNSEILALVDRCIVGLEQCVIRLPQNYKAIYRLGHIYYNYKPRKDLSKCRQLLLGLYTCKGGTTITGLFSDRKPQNFFNGIWRIPSSEIDRPGSLSAHMSRCTTLLLQILRATNDHKLLLDLSMQFRRTPDPDKIYIKDSERIQFADHAMAMCIQCLRSMIQNASESASQRLLHDIFRSYQRVHKHEVSKEGTFASMLTEVYKKLRKDKIPENANVLDLAVKFCQQSRVVEKQKRQAQSPVAAVARSAAVSSAPVVLPAPSMVAPPPQAPLKRPGLGRPRGRPPLPKPPGQTRPAKPRNPGGASNNFWQKAMFDQNVTYNFYLKQYQEELIKQYSQSLNLSQLSQLTQLFGQNQLTQSQYASQLMAAQNPLLNNPTLLKQMTANQQTDTKTQNLIKKKNLTGVPDKLSITATTPAGLNLDSLKAFGQHQQSQNKPTTTFASKKNIPHTVTSSSQSNSIVKSAPTTNKTSAASSPFSINSLMSNSQSSKSNKKDIPHTITSSMTQSPLIGKQSSLFGSDVYKSGFLTGAGASYSTAGGATKTTSSTKIFKEPSVSKPVHHPKTVDKTANIIMKDRPNISITPVMQNPMSLMTTSSFMAAAAQTSPVKTLQEKLADKQKQLSAKQYGGRKIEAEIISASAAGGVKKNLNIPSIPANLTLSKGVVGPYKFPMESGISISQIPVTRATKVPSSVTNLQQKSIQKVSTTKVPPNLPITLSVIKQPEKKYSSDDDVILIE